MRLEPLNITVPAFYWEVTDHFIYYLHEKKIVRIGLSDKQKIVFEIPNYPEHVQRVNLKVIESKVHIFYFHSHHFNSGMFAEFVFNAENKTAHIVNAISMEKWYCTTELAKNLSADDVKVFCYQNRRLYDINLSENDAAFVANKRLYHMTREDSQTFLNSFKLDDKRSVERVELTALNDVDELFEKTPHSCVFGDEVFMMHTGKAVMVPACICRLDLRSNTIENITDSIDGLFAIRCLLWQQQNSNAIYISSGANNEYSIFRIKVLTNDESSRSNCIKCPVCKGDFEIPKVFPACGHSICAHCEEKLFEEAVNRGETARCPTCRVVVELAEGQPLPVNYTLQDVLELRAPAASMGASVDEKLASLCSSLFAKTRRELANEVDIQTELKLQLFRDNLNHLSEKAESVVDCSKTDIPDLGTITGEIDQVIEEHHEWKKGVLEALRK